MESIQASPHSDATQQFCAITGTNPTEAEHILEAVNYNVERAVDLFFSGGPTSSAAGADVVDMTNEENDADAAAAAALYEEDLRKLQDEPLAPTESHFDPFVQGLGFAQPHGPARPSRIQSPSDEDEEPPTGRTHPFDDEDEDMLSTMAAQRRRSVAAAVQSQQAREATMGVARRGVASNFVGGTAGGIPSVFPGLTSPFPDFGRMSALAQAHGFGLQASDFDLSGGHANDAEASMGGPHRRIPVQEQGQGSTEEDGDAALARRLLEEDEEMGMTQPTHAGPSGVSMQGDGGEEAHAAGLHGAFDRHELEEARMLEASMLGIPYQPRLPTRGAPSSAAPHPELGEQRSLRYEQDQAYEESLAADRAKEEAAQMAAHLAEAEAKRTREEAEASARAQAEEEARIKLELSRKAASLPSEPSPSEPDTVNIMIRWPDGARQARRFRKHEPLQAVFDYVDLQHQAASVKPGTYNLVNSYPRKAFSDGTTGSLADAGLNTDTALFLEPKA